jgi:tRNA threonylcarbamoyl adenosine modification protein YeaZ
VNAPARLVLGIDTSTVVNVGLAFGGTVLATATENDARAHVEELMPLVMRCLTAAGRRLSDVDQIVVGLGPGPFTGLRVGIATARVLSTVLSTPLHGICSLDVIAAQHLTESPTSIPTGSSSPPGPARSIPARWRGSGPVCLLRAPSRCTSAARTPANRPVASRFWCGARRGRGDDHRERPPGVGAPRRFGGDHDAGEDGLS